MRCMILIQPAGRKPCFLIKEVLMAYKKRSWRRRGRMLFGRKSRTLRRRLRRVRRKSGLKGYGGILR